MKKIYHFIFIACLSLFAGISVKAQTVQPSALTGFPNTNGVVNAIAWDSTNNAIYIGGTFTNVGGSSRLRFAAINATTGALLPWAPSFNNDIIALHIYKGMLYVGGTFSTAAGQARTGLAKFKISTQTIATWNPNPGFNHIRAIDSKNNFIYFGGIFTNNLARVDTGSSTIDGWNSGVNATVYDLDISGNTLYAAGNFTSAGGQPRGYVAAYSLSGATPSLDLTWDPSADALVTCIKAHAGQVYMGGNFALVGSTARNRFACVDPVGTAGAATSMDFQFPNTVQNIVAKNNMVYVGGSYWNVIDGNTSITYNNSGVVEIDITSNAITKYNPSPGSSVNSLATGHNLLYVGGNNPIMYAYCANFTNAILTDINFITSTSNVCAGQTSPVPYSVDANSGATSYVWSNSLSGITVTTPTNDAVTMNFSGAAAGFDNLNVYGTNGCINTNSLNLGVNVYQFASKIMYQSSGYSIGTPGSIVCGGSDTMMTSDYYLGSGTISYTWAPSGTLNSTHNDTVGTSVKTTTVYTLTAVTSDGCSSTDTLRLIVSPISLSASSSFGAILCSTNDTLHASDNYPGLGSVSYTWTPSTSVSNSHGTNPLAHPVVSTTYTLTASSTDGCSATATTTFISVNPISLTLLANPNTLPCGDHSNLSVTTDYPGTGLVTYTWTPSASLSNSHIATPLASPTVSTTYTVDIKTVEGCVASDVVFVNVDPLQIVTSGSVSTTCSVPITLNTSCNSANNNLIYSWSPAGGVNNSASANPNANVGTTTVFTVTVSLPSTGCVSASAVDTVNILPPVAPNICEVTSDSSSLNNIIYWDKTSYQPTDSFIVYRETTTNVYTQIGVVSWNALSEFTDTARHIGPANGDPNVGTYRYKLAVKDSCGNISSQSPYHNSVYFVDNHTGTFTWNLYAVENQTTPVTQFDLMRDNLNNGTWIVIGSVTGTQNTLNDPNYSTYQSVANWRVQALGFNCTPTMRYGNNGTQGAVIKSKSNITNNRQIGIKTNALENTVAVYPNPSNGNFVIDFGAAQGKVTVKIISLLGEEIYNTTVNASEKLNVDLSAYQSATYVMQITSNNTTVIKRIVKN